MRVGITLACSECKQRNYVTTKDKRKQAEKLELKKYCKFCNSHTVHKEIK
ncbi:MAG: 50S ribosomal protein L33 [Syntrophomonadaceae bacterium]|nr:50S ribosomal protein L33 [Syntrophomonadaceae bacterium]